MDYLFELLIFMNCVSFLFFGIDKYLAQRQKHRISERSLLLLTFFGGSIGSVLSMFLFRHKISKPSFWWKVVVIIILQMIFIYLIFNYLKK
jgi:uncharacterized membrane protein YsdA (DUF1294 family)